MTQLLVRFQNGLWTILFNGEVVLHRTESIGGCVATAKRMARQHRDSTGIPTLVQLEQNPAEVAVLWSSHQAA